MHVNKKELSTLLLLSSNPQGADFRNISQNMGNDEIAAIRAIAALSVEKLIAPATGDKYILTRRGRSFIEVA